MFSARIDMSLSLRFGSVEAGALQNYVNTDLAPGQLCCVSLRIDLDFLAINSDRIFASRNLVSQRNLPCVESYFSK